MKGREEKVDQELRDLRAMLRMALGRLERNRRLLERVVGLCLKTRHGTVDKLTAAGLKLELLARRRRRPPSRQRPPSPNG